MLGATKLAAILAEQMSFSINDQVNHTVELVRQKADALIR